MDEILKMILSNTPSFAGLLLMLYWQQRRIDQLLQEVIGINRQLIELLERQVPTPSKDRLP